jgi:hypothetical protein
MSTAKGTKTERHSAAMRSNARKTYVEGLRDGRKIRATTFTDRKKQASKNACRGRWAA